MNISLSFKDTEAPEPKAKVARISKSQVAGDVIVPELQWRGYISGGCRRLDRRMRDRESMH